MKNDSAKFKNEFKKRLYTWVLLRHFKLSFLFLIFAFYILLLPLGANAGTIVRPSQSFGTLRSGLVGYWSFDAGDMAKNTAYDRSGQNNTGTLTNGPTRAIGELGQALSFDGVNDYVDVGQISLSGAMTMCTWITFNQLGQSGGSVFISNHSEIFSNAQYSLQIDNNGAILFNWVNAGISESYVTGNNSVSLGNWYHICGVRITDSDVDIYINGADKAVTASGGATVPSSPPGNTAIGRAGSGNADYLRETIDEVRLYNRALTSNEIKRLYSQGTSKLNSSQNSKITNGLVGYWSFDGADIAKTTAYDRSGQGNNGSIINSTSTVGVAGKFGQALNFDGKDDYVNIPNMSLASDFTVSAWVRLATDSGGHVIGYRTNADNSIKITTTSVSGEIANSGYSTITTDPDFTVGEWQQLTFVRSGSNGSIKVYRNGVLAGTGNEFGSVTRTFTPTRIGSTHNVSSFNGQIDDVRIYNRALSPDEIKRLYAMGGSKLQTSRKGGSSLDQGLVGYWTFDAADVAKNTAYDRSGQNNTGTLTNGPIRAAGKLGQALQFDGSNDYVNVADHTSLQLPLGNKITMSAWFKANIRSGLQGWIVNKRNGGATDLYGIRVDGGANTDSITLFIRGTDSSGINGTGIASNVSKNTWHHIVVTYDTSSGREYTYVDGVQTHTTASAPGTDIATTGALTISAQTPGISNEYLSAIVDDVRIYNRALSPDEIKRLYAMGR